MFREQKAGQCGRTRGANDTGWDRRERRGEGSTQWEAAGRAKGERADVLAVSQEAIPRAV